MKIQAIVYDYSDNVINSHTSKSLDIISDIISDYVATCGYAKQCSVKIDGITRDTIRFDELRDRALLEGYILPVHEQMIANGEV